MYRVIHMKLTFVIQDSITIKNINLFLGNLIITLIGNTRMLFRSEITREEEQFVKERD